MSSALLAPDRSPGRRSRPVEVQRCGVDRSCTRDRRGTLVGVLVVSVGIAAAGAFPVGVAAAGKLESQQICPAGRVSRDVGGATLLPAVAADSQPSCHAGAGFGTENADTMPAVVPGSDPACEPDSTRPASGDTVSAVKSPGSRQASEKPLVVDRWLAPDKAKHLAVSACLAGLFYQSGRHFMGLGAGDSRQTASVATLAIGISKEIRDRGHPGSSASWRDLAADGAGVLAGLLVFSVMLR